MNNKEYFEYVALLNENRDEVLLDRLKEKREARLSSSLSSLNTYSKYNIEGGESQALDNALANKGLQSQANKEEVDEIVKKIREENNRRVKRKLELDKKGK